MTDPAPVRRRRALPVLGLVVALAAAATLYGRLHQGDKGGDCPASSAATLAALKPYAQGDVAALVLAKTPAPALPLTFQDEAGKPLTLADFNGKALLVNLWATWCVPCRAEMPALDRLQAKAGGEAFQVVAINVDTARLEKPKAFLDAIGVKHLTRFADPKADSFETLRVKGKALGLPTSLIIDKAGCELGVVGGPAAWDGEDAARLIAALKAG